MRKLTDLERERALKDEDSDEQPAPRHGAKNYITPSGYARLKNELAHLLDNERPELVKVIAWAASNGDRSENADYIYGKRRLREIDRRIRFLTKRLEIAEVIDPVRKGVEQVFFGATVTYCNGKGVERTVSIVGQDEVDPPRGRISWISPVARALSKARKGDVVSLKTPAGTEQLELIEIRYVQLA
ncbi:MAG: transcription elongation factor GreB [Betaproteobacteria bacterium]|nr:transcription elongation factor GreB [Betaproteobacteria bacterium]